MARTTYTAQLSNGDLLTRTTARTYAAAYAVFDGAGEYLGTGFAASIALAERAAADVVGRCSGRSHFNRCTSNRARTSGEILYHRDEIRRMGGRQAWAADVARRAAELRVEIVPAIAG